MAFALLALTAAAVPPALSATAATVAHASVAELAVCNWDRPGHDRFRGDTVAAIDRYTDIAPDVRSRLKQRMARRDYDEVVSIRRDEITGTRHYDSDIRDMHFGAGSVCRKITRSGWTAQMHERGMVYCEAGQCILVPTVCRNVSRIVRHEPAATASAQPGSSGSGSDGELAFDPPGAGVAPAALGGGAPGSGAVVASDSFAGRSTDAGPSGLFAGAGSARGSSPAPGAGPGSGSGPSFESDAAQPGREALPALAWPPAPSTTADLPGLQSTPVSSVPEPGTWLMLAAGLALLGALSPQALSARSPTAR